MKRLIGALVMVGVLVAPAAANAYVPDRQDRGDAVRFARDFWEKRNLTAFEYSGCRRIRSKVGYFDPRTGHRYDWFGYWSWNDPCRIVFNANVDWSRSGKRADWWDLCATAIHEYGHAVGKPHNFSNPNSIMAVSEPMNHRSWWWPYYPGCRYDGDDQDRDGLPDY